MSSWVKIYRSLFCLLLPSFCTFIIHHFFQKTFGENNLTLGIYSRDIYIPLIFGSLFALYHMVGNGVSVRIRTLFFLCYWVFLFLIIIFLKNYLSLSTHYPHDVLVFILLMSCFFVLCLAFLSTIQISEVLRFVNRRNTAAIYSLVALLSLLNYPVILKFFWKQASFCTAKSVYYIYKLFGVNLNILLTPVSFNLSGSGFGIKIIMGCSGLEGIFFFLFAFSLVQLIAKRGINWGVFFAYIGGVVLLFGLNIIRISAFYLVGIYFNKISMGRLGRQLIEGAFHNHLGWLLYIAGIFIFIRGYRKMESHWAVRESNP